MAGLGDKIKVYIVLGVLARTVSSKTRTSRNRRRKIVSLLYRRQPSARGVVCQLEVSSRSIQSKTIGMIGVSTVRIAILHTFPPPRGNVNSTSTTASLMVLRGASLPIRDFSGAPRRTPKPRETFPTMGYSACPAVGWWRGGIGKSRTAVTCTAIPARSCLSCRTDELC